MASRIITSRIFLQTFQNLRITNCGSTCQQKYNFLNEQSPSLTLARSTSFFTKLPAEHLWKGVISVSNAGKKRGRGKGAGRKIAKDLNRGQVIGVGKVNMLWPGLNSPIIRGRELVRQQKLPEDPEHDLKLKKIRDSMGTFRALRINPIDRGWSGSKMPGRSIGAPDPIGEDIFENFDTRVLEMKTVFIMKGNLGRKRRFSVLSVTGNGNGLAGFSLVKAVEVRTALRKSKNRAGQKLMHIDLCDGHTVFHDFFCQFGKTKIFVTKKPQGYGLVCHRAIATICKVLGIKDLHAKVEGSKNLQHVVKAFFLGLLQQKSHQQIADDTGMHLVEFRKEFGDLPKVIASPAVPRAAQDIKNEENMSFTQYCHGGKVVLKRKKFPPFYVDSIGYQLYIKKKEKRRNHDKIRLDMLVEHGEIRSFLTDKYPESRPVKWLPKEEATEAN